MLWRRTAPAPVIPPLTPVPDAERLRLAALQASWSRGHWVARRRVALRWLLWFGWRYLLPVLAISGLTAWLWLSVLPAAEIPVTQFARWLPSLTQPSPPHQPPSQEPAADSGDMPQTLPTHTPEGEPLDSWLGLQLETRWAGAAESVPSPALPEATATEPDLQPLLKPENWLHSKEP